MTVQEAKKLNRAARIVAIQEAQEESIKFLSSVVDIVANSNGEDLGDNLQSELDKFVEATGDPNSLWNAQAVIEAAQEGGRLRAEVDKLLAKRTFLGVKGIDKEKQEAMHGLADLTVGVMVMEVMRRLPKGEL